ncbi:MAG: ATPase [Robiginitalea sp.]|uniref:ATPase n=1 Tax=Robiginitalea sp. TaxID=1902411 RepID=UPI003C7906A8
MAGNPKIVKASGERVPFSAVKLKKSLSHSGAPAELVDTIVGEVTQEVYEGMPTSKIYNRAFALLRAYRESCASRYKLKQAIYELGPTGFPFERFISAVLSHSGFKTQSNKSYQGKCVSHEIDVVATNEEGTRLIECKYHSDPGKKCDVKVPLYIHSRFEDVLQNGAHAGGSLSVFKPGWVVTNTRFTGDAEKYGICVGLYLLSWNYPAKNSLKRRIDRSGLYPITVSPLLSAREKQLLLERGPVLCREVLKKPHLLDQIGISKSRKKRILKEFTQLCTVNASHEWS